MIVHQGFTTAIKRDTDKWIECQGDESLVQALAGCRKFWSDDESLYEKSCNTNDVVKQNDRTLIVVPPMSREYLILVGVTKIPALDVRCDVTISHCIKLERLQHGFSVTGDLHIEDCENLFDLPEGLTVFGSLTIVRCKSLRTLPAGLFVQNDCKVIDCSDFSYLPLELHVGGDLQLNTLPSLEELPRDFTVRGRAVFSYGANLALYTDEEILHRAAPSSVLDDFASSSEPSGHRRAFVKGALRVICCEKARLAESTWIGGTLCIAAEGGYTGLLTSTGFPSSKILPFMNLNVNGNMYIEGLSGNAELPINIRVGGNAVILQACWGVTCLPSGLFATRRNTSPLLIRLVGTGILGDALAALQTIQVPHVNIEIIGLPNTTQELDNNAVQGSSRDIAARDLEESLRFWHPTVELNIDPAYQRGVQMFLRRLRDSKEYNTTPLRDGLYNRVREVLELLASSENSTQAELLSRIGDSVDTCGDKPIWALNQMCALAAISNARTNREQLREVGRGVMRLGIVHEFAKQKLLQLGPDADDVCVFLRYEIELRERLRLPVSALQMLYGGYVEISEADFETAARAAESISEDRFLSWLESWDEWRRHSRQCQVVSFENLNKTSEVSSGILGTMSRTVLYRNEEYEYDELVNYWVRTGLDLTTNTRIDAITLFENLLGYSSADSEALCSNGPLQSQVSSSRSYKPEATYSSKPRRIWIWMSKYLPSRSKKAV
mmetsp:Transcript_21294/g.41752  ORF Transcript_21294/g.41752 Transcript_21294/m.41752 type:complete len:724 (+) Transcript_21294:568-2739(+)|eukprot:CAMPEP_0171545688 /NCGR_PEP_ID=MMETSP0960-20121227/4216_1 /TAXON_ID=87120 /ORGANISM="Aurantiochytrium limacinum, Strain ATCCMYA-1381" /LENGTH=723 /DNA_ID=CAMNT_0012093677 /DNA_START=550 /DNA_END=2721 /DNA_ORIENTATION=+